MAYIASACICLKQIISTCILVYLPFDQQCQNGKFPEQVAESPSHQSKFL